MKVLAGRVAVVTGGASGIGKGIAVAFAREGASIAIADRVPEPQAADAMAGVREQGGEAIFVRTNVSNAASVASNGERGARAIRSCGHPGEQCRHLHGVADRAHVHRGVGPRRQYQSARYLPLYARAARADARAGDGRIINIASQLGQIGGMSLGHYAASKAGIIGLTKSLAREVSRRGVLVNAIAPGPILTPMMEAETEAWRSAKLSELPIGRFGTVDEVAPTAVLLASPAGTYYVGQTLGPNGGDAMI